MTYGQRSNIHPLIQVGIFVISLILASTLIIHYRFRLVSVQNQQIDIDNKDSDYLNGWTDTIPTTSKYSVHSQICLMKRTTITLVSVLMGQAQESQLAALHRTLIPFQHQCSDIEWFIVTPNRDSSKKIMGMPNATYFVDSNKIHQMKEYINVMKAMRCENRPCAHYLVKLFLDMVIPDDRMGAIVMDLDLLVQVDLIPLWSHLNNFGPTQSYALVREMQPSWFRWAEIFPNCTVGFNGGLQLQHFKNLRRMRKNPNSILSRTYDLIRSDEFQNALQDDSLLGDQDWYNGVNIFHPELFYELPCQWNKQVCMLWYVNSENKLPCLKHQNLFWCPKPKIVHFNCWKFGKSFYLELLKSYWKLGRWPRWGAVLRRQCEERLIVGKMDALVSLSYYNITPKAPKPHNTPGARFAVRRVQTPKKVPRPLWDW